MGRHLALRLPAMLRPVAAARRSAEQTRLRLCPDVPSVLPFLACLLGGPLGRRAVGALPPAARVTAVQVLLVGRASVLLAGLPSGRPAMGKGRHPV